MNKLFTYLAVSACLLSCKTSYGPVTVSPSVYNINADTGALPQVPGNGEGTTSESVDEVAGLIAPYKAQLDAKMNRVLAEIVTPLKKGSPESNLGNWMADIMQVAATEYYPDHPIAFAATNSGGLRVSEIGAGPLIVSEIYELMPFDNKLVVLPLTGVQVKEFINHIANSGGWPVSDELRVNRSGGKLNVKIKGRALDPAATYYVATIDYVANGGSNSSMLKGIPQIETGYFLRDVLIDFAGRSTAPIDVKSTGERMKL
ncbi:5'-nucleotidase C-terminal domain-containing protein [Lewinella sp. 4G2]|uniref:5'-nucleotidase C-terminal domain-containing protein n=1 Tax=Lewinella sp. 4G2 TaxID=1803372 RepID=UPI0007B4C42A|nr:5'-nucleotidase [Lewinella sp. 4G2]OAV44904.1 hypothetical protein A3850_010550 [Lewinella sp. 4G2]